MSLVSKVYSSIASVGKKRSHKKKKKTQKRKKSILQTMPYGEYLQTDYWKKVREAKFDQVGRKCQICGCTERLEIHHKHYKYRGKELRNLKCLMVLCRKHHQMMHDISSAGASK